MSSVYRYVLLLKTKTFPSKFGYVVPTKLFCRKCFISSTYLKVIAMSCRTSHRAICSERHGRNAPFCNRPERRRRPRVCTQQRGRHSSSTRQRRTETHIDQILRHNGRAILAHHDRRSISADDSGFSHITRGPIRHCQHQHQCYSQRIYVVH